MINLLDCPDNTGYPRFCPNDPLRRASAAVMMSRALGLVELPQSAVFRKEQMLTC